MNLTKIVKIEIKKIKYKPCTKAYEIMPYCKKLKYKPRMVMAY